jgi:hypothetical protein
MENRSSVRNFSDKRCKAVERYKAVKRGNAPATE